nr:MAG TPA: hypothetical protein [Caudoviricetes sp.]
MHEYTWRFACRHRRWHQRRHLRRHPLVFSDVL